MDSDLKKRFEKELQEDVALLSTFLDASGSLLFEDTSNEAVVYLTLLYFKASQQQGDDDLQPSESLPDKCPRFIGLLTLKEIPDDCFTCFKMKVRTQFVDVNFKYYGCVKLNRAQYRNLCWYHLAIVDLMMYQCHTLDEVSTMSKKESLDALLHDIADFMKPKEGESWYLIAPICMEEAESFITSHVKKRNDCVIDHEVALAAVAAIRNFSGTGAAEAAINERSNVFLSAYNASCYTVHDNYSRTKFSDPFPQRRRKSRPPEFATYGDYYRLKLGFTDLDMNQDLIGARCFMKPPVLKRARHLLNPSSNETLQGGAQTAFVVPALLRVHPLKLNTIRAGPIYLATCWMFESILRVAELRNKLMEGLPPSPRSALGSLGIKSLLNAVSFGALTEGRDYNALEFIGDTVVKLISAFYSCLFCHERTSGRAVDMRHRFVSNATLAKACVNSGLYKYIRHLQMGEHSWRPAGAAFLEAFRSRHKMECPMEDWNPKERQARKYKMFADVVEAVLGTCYLEAGIKTAVQVTNQLGIAPLDTICHAMESCDGDVWLTEAFLADCSAAQTGKDESLGDAMDITDTSLDISEAADVEDMIGYKFRNRTYLEMSLVRNSQKRADCVFDYLRLAFLGDALIDIAIVQELFKRNPNGTAGELTALKQSCYNQESICRIVISRGLDRHIKIADADIKACIEQYKQQLQQDSAASIFGEGLDGSPVVLHTMFQCLTGAIFLDTGGSLSRLMKILNPLIEPLLSADSAVPPHPVLLLANHFSNGHKAFRLKLRQDPEKQDDDACLETDIPPEGDVDAPHQERKMPKRQTKSEDDASGVSLDVGDEKKKGALPSKKRRFVVDVLVGDKVIGTGTSNCHRSARREAAIAALNTLKERGADDSNKL